MQLWVFCLETTLLFDEFPLLLSVSSTGTHTPFAFFTLYISIIKLWDNNETIKSFALKPNVVSAAIFPSIVSFHCKKSYETIN